MAGDEESDLRSIDLLGILHGEEEEEEPEEGKRGGEDRGQHEQVEKQEQHYLRSIGAAVLIRQLRSRGLSFQLWPAASTLFSLLDQNSSLLLTSLPTSPSPPLRVLEVGSGTGLVGIAAAAVLRAHVTITDLPHVLPNLQFNAESNEAMVASHGGAVEVRQLRWGYDQDSEVLAAAAGVSFNLILASDVVYYDHLIDPLLQTLRFFVKGEAAFVMAHLRRWKKRDAVFFRKARKVFDVEVLHKDPPLPGSRIGVVVYRFVEKSCNSNIATAAAPATTDTISPQ